MRVAATLAFLGVLLWNPQGVQALTIDASTQARPAGVTTTVRGTVASTWSFRDPDGLLRTEVVLAASDGREVARFDVLGGVEDGLRWVVDGIPGFVTGESVDVDLTAGGALAPGEASVRRVAPSAAGRSGADWERVQDGTPSTVTDLSPSVGGAAPGNVLPIRVRGSGFGDVQGDSRVTFQGLFERVDAPVLSWSNNEIVCLVPAPGLKGAPQVLSGPVKVWTAEGGWSDGNEFIGGARFGVLFQWAGDAWLPERLPISFYVNPTGCPYGTELANVCVAASAQWSVSGSYARFVYRGLTQAETGPHENEFRSPRDGRNTVHWRTTWPYEASWLAVTWSAIDTLTLERQEAELDINGLKPWTLDPEAEPNRFDLQSTLTHEFGHWLRLGHTQNVASVMGAFTEVGVMRRQLGPADRFGASWIHPSYGIIVATPAVASGGAVDVAILALDRQGDPLQRLDRHAITLRAVQLPEDGVPAKAPDPLALASSLPATRTINAGHDTDDDGSTFAVIPGLSDGLYRIEMEVEGRFVRPAPVVRVGVAPVVSRPTFSFAGVAPMPLRAGVRGVVRFTLPSSSHVVLEVFDAAGRRVRTLADERFEAGAQEVPVWTTDAGGRTLAGGVYFLRMSSRAGYAFAPTTRRVVVLP